MIPNVLFIPLCPSSSWQHNELRYSLRSWEKYGPQIKTLLIIGYLPEWIKDVHHLPFQERWNKPQNIYEKVKLAAAHYKDFIFSNDDHFLVSPMTDLPYYRSGKLVDFKGNAGDTFMRYVTSTWTKFPDGYYFDVHTPMVVKSSIIEQMSYDRDLLFKSFYCNTAKIEGVEFKDCKVKEFMRYEQVISYVQGKEFISTGEAISAGMKQWFAEEFPEKSRWEK